MRCGKNGVVALNVTGELAASRTTSAGLPLCGREATASDETGMALSLPVKMYDV